MSLPPCLPLWPKITSPRWDRVWLTPQRCTDTKAREHKCCQQTDTKQDKEALTVDVWALLLKPGLVYFYFSMLVFSGLFYFQQFQSENVNLC